MTPSTQLRQHTDGRVAVKYGNRPLWIVLTEDSWTWWPEDDVAGPGWSELLVAKLPEPDYGVDDLQVWDLHTGEMLVDETDGHLQTPHLHTIDQLRSDARKMLAAIAACERYRAQREATT